MAATDKDSFLVAYKKLPEKSATTIRLFERGEKYSVYGEDTHYITKELSHTSTGIKKLHNADVGLTVDYYNIPKANSDLLIRDLLLIKQRRVEVWVNTGPHKWVAEYKGSPGNLIQFEDLIFSNAGVPVNNGVIGVRLGSSDRNKVVGLAFVNTNECIINLVEFLDNEAFTNFESVLVQLAPKEAVMPIGAGAAAEDMNNLHKILTRNSVMVNQRKASDFDSKDVSQDLQRLLKQKSGQLQNISAHPEMEKLNAVHALSGVIKYLELLSNEIYFNQFHIEPFDFSLYVKMDSAAAQAVHIISNPYETGSRNVTLASILDKCRTAQGHRLLAQYLRQPIVDKDKLEERLDLVEIFMENISLRKTLTEEHLRRVPDCQSLARKFAKKKATLQDCYKSYLCLVKLPKLVEELESADSPKKSSLLSTFVDPLKTLLSDFDKFVEMIQTTLDLDLAEQGEFMVRPNFDDTLQSLRDEMDTVKSQMESEAKSVAQTVKLDDKSLKLETNTKDGFYFRVTLKDEKSIRHRTEIIVMDTNKAGVRFRTRKLESLNEKHQKKLLSYQENQKAFMDEIMNVSSGYHNGFEQLGNILSVLDVVTSFATVASNAASPYVRPVLHPRGTGKISFQQLRHPCVEAQPGVNFIPNDITFEKGKHSFYIVTGPNMGGKSTFLRSVGVATLLAQIGCFVPAEKAEISIVDSILARVGAGDCLTKGVSTFMAEMIETSFILNTASSDSLVLIDELGRGTSTFDGFGLCWAISQHLASEVDCFAVLATHFHELTALADEIPSVVNVHVTALADESGLAMLYKIEPGSCDRSFGLHVAQVTDFPEDVIKMAKGMAQRLEDYSGELDQDDSEVAVKRRRQEKQDGHSLIDKFLKNIEELQRNATDNSDFQAKAKELLETVKKSNNPYISHLCSTFCKLNQKNEETCDESIDKT